MPRLFLLIAILLSLSACSGAIYRQSAIRGDSPVAITVDARQRVLLSQLERDRTNHPAFRRFCAEASPDVFTVLGVSASGGGSLDIDDTGSKALSAALQAAFASSETGTTIARTQTVTMLREMMFRTCERYLSGAISAEEFHIIAARDQRIMVSILAIEQLTGAITPRSVAINASGTADTGLNPTQMVKLISEGQAALQTAEENVAADRKKLIEADIPAGNCETLRKKKAEGKESWTADDTTKLATCDKAQADLNMSVAKRDIAQARYDDLVAASKRGMGISTASASGKVDFAADTARTAAVTAVALSVENIVEQTFNQDETQLMCIRVLSGESKLGLVNPEITSRCLLYLMQKVDLEREHLAEKYGLTIDAVDDAQRAGREAAIRRRVLALTLRICVADPARAKALSQEAANKRLSVPVLTANTLLRDIEVGLNSLGDDGQQLLSEIAAQVCLS